MEKEEEEKEEEAWDASGVFMAGEMTAGACFSRQFAMKAGMPAGNASGPALQEGRHFNFGA